MIIGSGLSTNTRGSVFRRQPGFEYWTLGCILQGVHVMRSEGIEVTTRNKRVVLFPPDTPYEFNTITTTRDIWAIFQPSSTVLPYLNRLTLKQRFFYLMLEKETPYQAEITSAFREMHTWWSNAIPMFDLADNCLERALMLVYHSISRAEESDSDRRLLKVVEYINAHYIEDLHISDLARIAHLSVSRFAHIFKNQYKISPSAFVENQRIAKARELLLSTHRSVQEIADMTGFSNQFHFSARFKKLTGQSPSQFRKLPRTDRHTLEPEV
jgi:AraC family transcriptional regulator of arabinose operon